MIDDKEVELANASWTSTGDIFNDFFNYFENLQKGNDYANESIPSGTPSIEPLSDTESIQISGCGNPERASSDGCKNQ